MNKILKPYTIIPPDLYVEREADRQVDGIIQDMGRPGYVLVSRQMGKTNLLLNAKRRLENEDTIFGYIDLSNPFENVRGCFENIIDTILETNEDILSDIQDTIKNNRNQKNDIPPFKQHTNELRLILKHIKGKLVIILDEIDALTKKTYSDQIFAQIRSVYFSRANFRELENLTYILSGVVEPNEIIKDPKISPFNIGEKIFLNDFSKSEFETFIVKSKLNLSQANKDRIFYWTNGNPRITWDVCAEIENKYSDKEILQDDIDKLISEMYLTAFDRPPIDNIRELVKSDRELRNAIIEIAYKKGNEVSDKIKSKLYLSGITNFNGNNNVHIKNEVIKQSLSLEWIKQIEEEDKGLINLALEFYDKEDYPESISYFRKFLENNIFEPRVESLYYYFMGSAAYHISDFPKAIEYLNLTKFSKEDGYFYVVLNLKGLVHFYAGYPDESFKFLQSVIDAKQGNEIYVRALLNYGSIAIKLNHEKYRDKAVRIFTDVTNELGFDRSKLLDEDFIKEVKAISFYNLAQMNNENLAVKYYESSLDLSRKEMKPIILLGLYNSVSDSLKKKEILTLLVDEIIDGELHPIQYDPEKQMTFNIEHLKEIFIVSFLYSSSEFERLKPWLHFLGEKSFADYIYDLFIHSVSYDADWDTGVALLGRIYENFNNKDYDVDDKIKYNTLRHLAVSDDKNIKIAEEYISLFDTNRESVVDYIDFSIFAHLIYNLYTRKKYKEALSFINIINSVKQEVSEDLLINYLVIYNQELNIYYSLNVFDKIRSKAQDIIDLCNNQELKDKKSNLLGDTGMETIRKNAEMILHPQARDNKPIVVGKVYGRNERVKVKYNDGRIVEAKFKKIENDIANAKCVIVKD